MTHPRGTIVSIGGAENKGTEKGADSFNNGILKHIAELAAHGDTQYIEIVTTATSYPAEVFETYNAAFAKLGVTSTAHMDIRGREQANHPDMLNRLQACSCIMFAGGDQLRLSSTFGGTAFLDVLEQRYITDDFVIAGTSAGAMVMSNPMIYEGPADKGCFKGEVKIVPGFGLIQHVILDTHIDTRGRFSRLAQAVAAQPGIIGIGLGEDTGAVVKQGHLLSAIGSGNIIIIDGKEITATNIAEIRSGMPIVVHNLRVHIMAAAMLMILHAGSVRSSICDL